MKITGESYAIRSKILERDMDDLRELSPEQVQTMVDLMKEVERERELLKKRREDLGCIRQQAESLEGKGQELGLSTKLTGEGAFKGVVPLLTIELEDETSVPKVVYKGKELTGKKKVNFEWETRREHPGTGGLFFEIEHFDKETKSLHIVGRKNGEYL